MGARREGSDCLQGLGGSAGDLLSTHTRIPPRPCAVQAEAVAKADQKLLDGLKRDHIEVGLRPFWLVLVDAVCVHGS